MRKILLIVTALVCLSSCEKFFSVDNRTTEQKLAENAESYGFHYDGNGVIIPDFSKPAVDSEFFHLLPGTMWLNSYCLEIGNDMKVSVTDYFAGKNAGIGRTHLGIEADSTFTKYFYDLDTQEACYSNVKTDFVNEYGAFRPEGSDLPYEHLLLGVGDGIMETIDCIGKDNGGYIFCYTVYTLMSDYDRAVIKQMYKVER